MKFISYDLRAGKVREGRQWLPTYLKDHGVEQVYDFPKDDLYIIDANDVGLYWFKNNIDHVSKTMLRDIRDKKAILIFNFDHYTFGVVPVHQRKSKFNVVQLIKKFSQLFDLDTDSLLYIDSNYKIETLLQKQGLHGHWFNLWEYILEPINNPHEIIEKITNKEIREKKFLYFGGKGREFRCRFLNSCFKIPNFRQDSFFSISGGHFVDTETKETKWMENYVLDIEHIDQGLTQTEAESITETYHLNSYFNVIPMSHFYMLHDQLEISEKLFKPISALQPFIILGQPRTLEALKDLGYKTFDKWIDESYDSTLDDNERYNKILQEVTRLSKLTNTELSDMLYDMLPTLIHNFELKKQRTRTYNPELLLNKLVSMFNHNN